MQILNEETLREIVVSSRFKKDYKKIKKRNLDIELFLSIVKSLANDIPLEEKHRDHQLKGLLKNFCECHVTPDWVLVYQKKDDGKLVLILNATGSHAHVLDM